MAKTVVHQDLKALWGDEDHLEIAQNLNFSELIFELLTERKPTSEELKVFNLILNLSIDHGPDTPSAIPVIKAAEEGKTISEALSLGIMEIGDVHGGAAEPLMKKIQQVYSGQLTVNSLIQDSLESGERLPGFGHRIYKDQDPRAQLILEKLKVVEGSGEYIQIITEMEAELEKQTGKHLPINIDGAIAVALLSMGFEPRAGIAVFLIARTPGLIAHYLNNS